MATPETRNVSSAQARRQSAVATASTSFFQIEVISVHLEDGEEGFLRDLDRAHLFHALLAFFLFLEELALAGNVAAVAFREHVLTKRFQSLARDDLRADRGLDRDFVHMLRNQFLQLLREVAAAVLRVRAVGDDRERV